MAVGLIFYSVIIIIGSSNTELFQFTSSTWNYLYVAGVTNCIAIYLFTYSTQRAKSATVALLRYIGVFYSFLVDLIIFKETFTVLQLLGVFLVLSTNIASIA
jgi:drug/metabolite transporter (DMT)-like permease